MRLVVDTTVLVGELLRQAGRNRLGDDRLELFLPEQMADEVQVEVPRRVAAFAGRHGLSSETADALVQACLKAIDASVAVVDAPVYLALEDEARARSLRDPTDWPLVAGALLLDGGVWTNDNDLLGTGVPTWTTEALQLWLDRHPDG